MNSEQPAAEVIRHDCETVAASIVKLQHNKTIRAIFKNSKKPVLPVSGRSRESSGSEAVR